MSFGFPAACSPSYVGWLILSACRASQGEHQLSPESPTSDYNVLRTVKPDPEPPELEDNTHATPRRNAVSLLAVLPMFIVELAVLLLSLAYLHTIHQHDLSNPTSEVHNVADQRGACGMGLMACHSYGPNGMRVSCPVRQMLRLMEGNRHADTPSIENLAGNVVGAEREG